MLQNSSIDTETERSAMKKGSFVESLLMALGSAIFFIAWGLWVNWEHGFQSRVQVALTQAGVSFIATLGLSELLRRIACNVSKGKFSWFKIGAIGWIIFNTFVFLTHYFAGTPEMLKTMLPGMLTGSLFSFAYGFKVSR